MWKELLPYEGKDLRQLDRADVDSLFDLLEKVFPEYSKSSSIADPYYIWRIQVQNNILRYVIVDGQQLQRIPGVSRAFISLFDEAGKLVGASEFSTGWRLNIKDMELIKESVIGVPVIAILSCPSGRDIARQYYALSNDQAVLVRLEDNDGNIAPNRYAPSNHMIGPIVPKRCVDEWEAALHSTNNVEILVALMWIGGIHDTPATSGYFGPGRYSEERESAEEVHQLRRRKLVQERLSRLKETDNQWIREAAKLAELSKA